MSRLLTPLACYSTFTTILWGVKDFCNSQYHAHRSRLPKTIFDSCSRPDFPHDFVTEPQTELLSTSYTINGQADYDLATDPRPPADDDHVIFLFLWMTGN